MFDNSIVNKTSPEANWNRQADRQADRQAGKPVYWEAAPPTTTTPMTTTTTTTIFFGCDSIEINLVFL